MSTAGLLTLLIAIPVAVVAFAYGAWRVGGWPAVRARWWAILAIVVGGVVISVAPSSTVLAATVSAAVALAIWYLAPNEMLGIRRLALVIALLMTALVIALALLAMSGNPVA